MLSDSNDFQNNFAEDDNVGRKKKPNWGVILAIIAILIAGIALALNLSAKKKLEPDDIALMVYKADLHNVQYKDAGVVSLDRNLIEWGGWKFIQLEKITFAYVGYVEAGFDLQKVTAQDILVSDRQTIILTLPPVKIFDPVIDDEKSDWDHEIFPVGVQPSKEMEQQVRQKARDELLQNALDDGLRENAQNNAQTFFEGFFRNQGFTKIEIRFW